MEGLLNYSYIITTLNAGVRMAMPVVLAAVGCIYCERSGVLNIGLEGQMLGGAFIAFLTVFFTKSLFLGIIGGVFGGMFLALILAISGISLNADQTISGIALNMFASGVSSFGFWILFGISTSPPIIAKLAMIQIPILSKIPAIGEILFNQSIIVYLCYILVFLSSILVFKTTFGLKLRACGEYPKAAETMGVNVIAMRYKATLICGAFAGLGGAFLSLVALGMFCDDVTAGRGFVALAIVIFGRWNPFLCLLAAFFFGTVDALQLRLQAFGLQIPYQFLLMLPYLFTIVTMIFTNTNTVGPASVGEPYEREQM